MAKDPKRRKAEELHSFLSSNNEMLHQRESTKVYARLKRDIAVFQDTGERSPLIEKIFRGLSNTLPTSVEAERAFSAADLFFTKIRSHLSDESIDKLCFFRRHFLNKYEV